ncbi:bifunctional pyr operon transcriptional regulator/uracil phosphoribosyltransferase PyrR [Candidatus Igneacidithiobacillus taiwanensis]|uniref:bifunctional pyr operon transcriptional regulator/uracil phosphoribosyltransferase PyrR n=1 Tax=Candidatus Igneacidithiobacillus taiwanensis TaxID=1945924 RepID=UPI00289C86C7|nr:bifunctional pyr operon transcriptional regulator/uracil phosphoribosyltransferase PyrR [Candidatus Igneacidithiobacillus taiwanensis]MCE5361284.1 bifunctional pyr operon transcriptional regulator/uracil phosphoribosyltransferase PyrR [Acidithiobacillus sp.]
MASVWEVSTLLDALQRDLQARIDPQSWAMIGIYTGGVWIAEELHRRLGMSTPLGQLDISFYRDDFSRVGLHPQVKASNLPFAIDGARIILVDDVLYTGRTIRAALNEIFDYGRPEQVLLAVLVDRGLRELPICPDLAALRLRSNPDDYVKLRGPQPLSLEFVQHPAKEQQP